MAVYRKPPQCPHCRQNIKAIHRKVSDTFVGDTFLRWDYQGHKCPEPEPKQEPIEVELKVVKNEIVPPVYEVPEWIAGHILDAREAYTKADMDEVYHNLYAIASHRFTRALPWRRTADDARVDVTRTFNQSEVVKDLKHENELLKLQIKSLNTEITNLKDIKYRINNTDDPLI